MIRDLLFAVDENGREYPFSVLETGKGLLLTLKKEFFCRARQLRVLPALSKACAGDPGYWILPRNIGMRGDIQTLFTPREDLTYTYEAPVMSWYGIKKRGPLLCGTRGAQLPLPL